MSTAAENRMRVARGQYGHPASRFRSRDYRMPRTPRHTPTEEAAREIAVEVAARLRLTLDDIRSPRRTQDLLAARRLIAALARQAGASLPEIGRVINRDHSTVLHGLRRGQAQHHPREGDDD